jgi:hypothetical protein
MRLAEREVARARSVIRSSRLGAVDKEISVMYSVELIPTARIRSPSKQRGSDKVIRISARQNSPSAGLSGSTLAMRPAHGLHAQPLDMNPILVQYLCLRKQL